MTESIAKGDFSDLNYELPNIYDPDGTLIDPEGELINVRNRFETYFSDAEVGSSKAHALYDFIELEKAKDILEECRGEVNGSKDPDTNKNLKTYPYRAYSRSSLRIAEQMVVGIQLRIQNNAASMPGYFVHQTAIGEMVDRIDTVASDAVSTFEDSDTFEISGFPLAEEVLNKIMLGSSTNS